MAHRRARGFTLVEVMMGVAIVGVLTSVAIPSMQKVSLRSKTAERAILMPAIKQAIEDYYVRNGRGVPAAGGVVNACFNPPFPPTPAKRPMARNIAGWNLYFSGPGGISAHVEGTVYYSYMFVVDESGPIPSLELYAAGDLDGDGVVAWRYTVWNRVRESFQPVEVFPPPGAEDDATYGSF